MESTSSERLKRVADYQTLQLTHYGRKSGRPYEVTIWYMVDAGRLYLASSNAARSWVRNVTAKPKVLLRIGGESFVGDVRQLEDPLEREHVMGLVEGKYWWASPMIWLGRMLAAAGLMNDNSATFEVVLTDN
ncbi:MAG TPA: nitroreductase family deazaflavin-dependent oxidoreductase [Candidatus Binataceae bacterium]|nr:nitroreductase family deazaflavin-dependent oxidoreductase [Candidatus Binataceae bacterium]